jgi:hypothetical protein
MRRYKPYGFVPPAPPACLDVYTGFLSTAEAQAEHLRACERIRETPFVGLQEKPTIGFGCCVASQDAGIEAGEIYITPLHLCFYSTTFNFLLPLSRIVSLRPGTIVTAPPPGQGKSDVAWVYGEEH